MYSWKIKILDRKRALQQEGYSRFDEALRALRIKLMYLVRKGEVDLDEFVDASVLADDGLVWQSDETVEDTIDNAQMELE